MSVHIMPFLIPILILIFSYIWISTPAQEHPFIPSEGFFNKHPQAL